jgi:hypothetical protein
MHKGTFNRPYAYFIMCFIFSALHLVFVVMPAMNTCLIPLLSVDET